MKYLHLYTTISAYITPSRESIKTDHISISELKGIELHTPDYLLRL